MNDLGALLAGLGGLLVGLIAVSSFVVAQRARKEAAEARATSPTAILEGLRTQVDAVIDAHQEAVGRWQAEREGLERALRRERLRADGAELVGLEMQATVAGMRIDLAAARAELAELKSRFDAAIGTNERTKQ